MTTEQYHIPKNGNGNKVNVLGWIMAFVLCSVNIITAVWIIATMNTTLADLKIEVGTVIETQKTQQTELNEHEVDIKLIQQGIKR